MCIAPALKVCPVPQSAGVFAQLGYVEDARLSAVIAAAYHMSLQVRTPGPQAPWSPGPLVPGPPGPAA